MPSPIISRSYNIAAKRAPMRPRPTAGRTALAAPGVGVALALVVVTPETGVMEPAAEVVAAAEVTAEPEAVPLAVAVAAEPETMLTLEATDTTGGVAKPVGLD